MSTKMDLKASMNDVEAQTKYKTPNKLKRLRLYLRDYSNNSSIHGVKYIGEKNRSWIERIFWSLLLISSISICGYLIKQTWMKWNTSPVIINFAQIPKSIGDIPFPAVTVCSPIKIKKSIYSYTDSLEKYAEDYDVINKTSEFVQNFEDASMICSKDYRNGNYNHSSTVLNFFKDVSPSKDEIFKICEWPFGPFSCAKDARSLITEQGICHTFNNMELFTQEVYDPIPYNNTEKSDWTVEGGYTRGFDSYPRRASYAGYKISFTLLLQVYEEDIDTSCADPILGFKILLHNPTDVPPVNQQTSISLLDKEAVILVEPKLMTTSEGLIDHKPENRKCYFASEKKLKYFQTYTLKNCEFECLTNYTKSICGCVEFYQPRENSSIPVCGSALNRCLQRAKEVFSLNEFKFNKNEQIKSILKGYDYIDKCNCLPSCTSLTYSSEIFQTDLLRDKLQEKYFIDSAEFNSTRFTRVRILFKEDYFIGLQRNELYGKIDFIANCGGLLGLFMGCSFFSLVEVIYYVTLRIYFNIKNHINN